MIWTIKRWKTKSANATPRSPTPSVSVTLPRTPPSAVELQLQGAVARPPAHAGTPQPPAAIRASPDGGYVLPGGRFRVTDDARTIIDFALHSPCGGGITLPPIRIDPSGAFAFVGHPPGAAAGTSATVQGRFVSSLEARGTTRVNRAACRGETVSFVARVS